MNLSTRATRTVNNNRTTTIDNDETVTVKGNRTETVNQNETITIHQNRTETVDQNETITIHKNRKERVDENESISIGGSRDETVYKNEQILIKGNRDKSVNGNDSLTVDKNRKETIHKSRSLNVDRNNTEFVKLGKSVTVGLGYATQVGTIMNTAVGIMQAEEIGRIKKTMVGKSYSISVGDKFEISVGSSKITMTPDSISITAKSILVGAEQENVIIGKDVLINPQGNVSVPSKEKSHAQLVEAEAALKEGQTVNPMDYPIDIDNDDGSLPVLGSDDDLFKPIYSERINTNRSPEDLEKFRAAARLMGRPSPRPYHPEPAYSDEDLKRLARVYGEQSETGKFAVDAMKDRGIMPTYQNEQRQIEQSRADNIAARSSSKSTPDKSTAINNKGYTTPTS